MAWEATPWAFPTRKSESSPKKRDTFGDVPLLEVGSVREGVVRELVPFYTGVGASEMRIRGEWKVKQNRKQKKS